MGDDQLPSWRDTPARRSIVGFIAAVTSPGSADFVPEPDRIAVFDNDGTLWTEQPVYAQLVFALDRAAELGQPTSLRELHAGGMPALTDLLKLTHAGLTTGEFEAASRRWLAAGRTRRWSTSRCWNCSACSAAAASPAGSSLAAVPISCGPGRGTSTACRRTA